MTALDYMTSEGRRPSFGRVGGRDGGFTVTSLRSRPGAPQATPPEGLGPPPGAGSGTNAMGASSWVNTFRNTGSAIQRQALAERAQMPGSQLFSGISQPIVNEFMAKAPSFGAVGMLTNPLSAPFGAAIIGGTQAPTATATATPASAAPAFDQDTASMMRDWLRSKVPMRSQWQSPTMARQDTSPRTVMRSIPGQKPNDYAYSTFPSWNQAFLRNG